MVRRLVGYGRFDGVETARVMARLYAAARQGVLKYCVDELDVHRVEALIHPDNVASTRLVEGLGFCCEGGPLTDYWRVGDRYVSVMIYAFINDGRKWATRHAPKREMR